VSAVPPAGSINAYVAPAAGGIAVAAGNPGRQQRRSGETQGCMRRLQINASVIRTVPAAAPAVRLLVT